MANTLLTPNTKPNFPSFFLKTWGTLYLFVLASFTPFLFYFIWGNHDWQWIKEGTPLQSGLFEGRFSQFILQHFLFGGQILPVLTLITALALFCSGAVLLFSLWNIPKHKTFYILLGLNLVCAPYTLSWLYFAFLTLSCLSWVLVVIAAFYLLQTKKGIIPYLISTILFTLALGGYPPVINLIGIIFFTLIINDTALKNLPPQSVLKKYIPHTLAIMLGIALFILAQYLLKKHHLQFGTYNTAEINLNELFPKFIATIKIAITQFFTTTAFIGYGYKYIGLFLLLLSFFNLWHHLTKKPANICLFFLSFIGLLFSSVLTFFVAQNTIYVANAPRIEFFSLAYIYIFSAATLLKTNTTFIRNIALTTLTLTAFHNINTISYAQKVWRLGFEAETFFSERLIQRIEEHPAFSLSKKYTFIQGEALNFRNRFYLPQANEKPNSYTLNAPFIPWHLPSKAYHFYYPQNFITKDFDIFWMYVSSHDISLTPSLIQYIQSGAQIWPDKNAVYIEDNTIILTITPNGQIRAREWLKKQNNLSS